MDIFLQNHARGYLELRDWASLNTCDRSTHKRLVDYGVWRRWLSERLGGERRRQFNVPIKAAHCRRASLVSRGWARRMRDWWRGGGGTPDFYFFYAVDNVWRCVENVYYWEAVGTTSIGLATRRDEAYLWVAGVYVGFTNNSIGYSPNGGVYKDGSRINGKKEPFTPEDIIGCGYDVSMDRVFFTKNGVLQFEYTWQIYSPLVPVTISGDINHGDRPFAFHMV